MSDIVPATIDHLPEKAKVAIESVPWASDDDAAIRIALAIFDAETPEEVLTPPENKLGLSRKYVGKSLTFHDVTWLPSTIEGQPLGRYALVTVSDDTGELFPGTIGGLNVMLQLAAINEMGGFPFKAELVQMQSQSNPDRKPLWLKMAGTQPGADF